MSGPFGTPARARRPAINVTSLIDVMFLLLIFFMVSSTFRTEFGLDVALPQASSATAEERPPYEVVIQSDGTIALGERRVDVATLEEEVRLLLENEPDATIVIRADKAASFQPFVSAMDAVRNAGGKKILVPTEPLATD